MKNVPEILWPTDMDRTLLDTNRTFDVFTEACEAEDIVSANLIYEAKAETERSGGSFDVMKYLRDLGVSGDGMTKLYGSFVDQARNTELLYKDAMPFMNNIAGQAIIVTYGGLEWQTAKILGAKLDTFPYLVTPFKRKGDMIASWKTDKHYEVTATNGEMLAGRTANLVDDKAVSFEGLPEDCAGFLLNRGGKILESQAGVVPTRVRTVSSLSEINVLPQLDRSQLLAG